MAGDSTAIGVGDRLKVAATDTPELTIDQQGKVATGLARSDYFNWGARMKELMTELLARGGAVHDRRERRPVDPRLRTARSSREYGTPEWSEAYRQRIGGIMDLAHDGAAPDGVGRRAERRATRRSRRRCTTTNQLAEEEAAKRPWVTYFDLASLVAGPDGGFAEYVTFPDGKQTSDASRVTRST